MTPNFRVHVVPKVKVDRCGWPTELSWAPGLDPDDLLELARITAGVDYPEDGNLARRGLHWEFCRMLPGVLHFIRGAVQAVSRT